MILLRKRCQMTTKLVNTSMGAHQRSMPIICSLIVLSLAIRNATVPRHSRHFGDASYCNSKHYAVEPVVIQLRPAYEDLTFGLSFCLWFRQGRFPIMKNQLLSFAEDRSSQKMILLLMSGIESNPGPSKYCDRPISSSSIDIDFCGICGKECRWDQHALACDSCDKWIHRKCCRYTIFQYYELASSKDPWLCQKCKTRQSEVLSRAARDKKFQYTDGSEQTMSNTVKLSLPAVETGSLSEETEKTGASCSSSNQQDRNCLPLHFLQSNCDEGTDVESDLPNDLGYSVNEHASFDANKCFQTTQFSAKLHNEADHDIDTRDSDSDRRGVGQSEVYDSSSVCDYSEYSSDEVEEDWYTSQSSGMKEADKDKQQRVSPALGTRTASVVFHSEDVSDPLPSSHLPQPQPQPPAAKETLESSGIQTDAITKGPISQSQALCHSDVADSVGGAAEGLLHTSDCPASSIAGASPAPTPQARKMQKKRRKRKVKDKTEDHIDRHKDKKVDYGGDGVWSGLGVFKCKRCRLTTTDEGVFNNHICSTKRSTSSPSSSTSSPTLTLAQSALSPQTEQGVLCPVSSRTVLCEASGQISVQQAPQQAPPHHACRQASSQQTSTLAAFPPPSEKDLPQQIEQGSSQDMPEEVLQSPQHQQTASCSQPHQAAVSQPSGQISSSGARDQEGYISYDAVSCCHRCVQCGYTGKGNGFIEHLMLQTTVKPYYCHYCPEDFESRLAFQKHCQQAHPNKPAKCKLYQVKNVKKIMENAVDNAKMGKHTAFSVYPGFRKCIRRQIKQEVATITSSCVQNVVALPVIGQFTAPASAIQTVVSTSCSSSNTDSLASSVSSERVSQSSCSPLAPTVTDTCIISSSGSFNSTVSTTAGRQSLTASAPNHSLPTAVSSQDLPASSPSQSLAITAPIQCITTMAPNSSMTFTNSRLSLAPKPSTSPVTTSNISQANSAPSPTFAAASQSLKIAAATSSLSLPTITSCLSLAGTACLSLTASAPCRNTPSTTTSLNVATTKPCFSVASTATNQSQTTTATSMSLANAANSLSLAPTTTTKVSPAATASELSLVHVTATPSPVTAAHEQVQVHPSSSSMDQGIPIENVDTSNIGHKLPKTVSKAAGDSVDKGSATETSMPVIIDCQGNYNEHEKEEVPSPCIEAQEGSPAVQSLRQSAGQHIVNPGSVVPSQVKMVSIASNQTCCVTTTNPSKVTSEVQSVSVGPNQAYCVPGVGSTSVSSNVSKLAKSFSVVVCQAGSVSPISNRAGQVQSVLFLPNQPPLATISSTPAAIVPSQSLSVSSMPSQAFPVTPVNPASTGFGQTQSVLVVTGQRGSSAPVLSSTGNGMPATGIGQVSLNLPSCQHASSVVTPPPVYVPLQTRPLVRSLITNTAQSNNNWRLNSVRNVRQIVSEASIQASHSSSAVSLTSSVSSLSVQSSHSSLPVSQNSLSASRSTANVTLPLGQLISNQIQIAYQPPQQLQQLSPQSVFLPSQGQPMRVLLPGLIRQPAMSPTDLGTFLRYRVPIIGQGNINSGVQNSLFAQNVLGTRQANIVQNDKSVQGFSRTDQVPIAHNILQAQDTGRIEQSNLNQVQNAVPVQLFQGTVQDLRVQKNIPGKNILPAPDMQSVPRFPRPEQDNRGQSTFPTQNTLPSSCVNSRISDPEKSTAQNVYGQYSPISPASSPIYTPISPAYTPISPASPVNAVYSPISPPASSTGQQGAIQTASSSSVSRDLSLTGPVQHSGLNEGTLEPSQNPPYISPATGTERHDLVGTSTAEVNPSSGSSVSVGSSVSAASAVYSVPGVPFQVTVTPNLSTNRATVKKERKNSSSEQFVSVPSSVSSDSVSHQESVSVQQFLKWKNTYACLICRKRFLEYREFYLHVWNHQHSNGEKCNSCSNDPATDIASHNCTETQNLVDAVSNKVDANLLYHLPDDCREKLSRRLHLTDGQKGPPESEVSEEVPVLSQDMPREVTSATLCENTAQIDDTSSSTIDHSSQMEKASEDRLAILPNKSTGTEEVGVVTDAGDKDQIGASALSGHSDEGSVCTGSSEGSEGFARISETTCDVNDQVSGSHENVGHAVTVDSGKQTPERNSEGSEEAENPEMTAVGVSDQDLNIEKPLHQNDPVTESRDDSRKNRRNSSCSLDWSEKQSLTRNEYSRQAVFFICFHCKFSSDTATDFTMHLNSDHPDEDCFPCYHCHYHGQYTTDLTNHITDHTLGASQIYLCPFAKTDSCTYGTDRVTSLGHHLKLHKDKTSFCCQKCGADFQHDMELLLHLRMNSMTLYSCSKCSSRFLEKQAIQQHFQATHSGGLAIRVVKVLLCLERKKHGYRPPVNELSIRRPSYEIFDDTSGAEINESTMLGAAASSTICEGDSVPSAGNIDMNTVAASISHAVKQPELGSDMEGAESPTADAAGDDSRSTVDRVGEHSGSSAGTTKEKAESCSKLTREDSQNTADAAEEGSASTAETGKKVYGSTADIPGDCTGSPPGTAGEATASIADTSNVSEVDAAVTEGDFGSTAGTAAEQIGSPAEQVKENCGFATGAIETKLGSTVSKTVKPTGFTTGIGMENLVSPEGTGGEHVSLSDDSAGIDASFTADTEAIDPGPHVDTIRQESETSATFTRKDIGAGRTDEDSKYDAASTGEDSGSRADTTIQDSEPLLFATEKDHCSGTNMEEFGSSVESLHNRETQKISSLRIRKEKVGILQQLAKNIKLPSKSVIVIDDESVGAQLPISKNSSRSEVRSSSAVLCDPQGQSTSQLTLEGLEVLGNTPEPVVTHSSDQPASTEYLCTDGNLVIDVEDLDDQQKVPPLVSVDTAGEFVSQTSKSDDIVIAQTESEKVNGKMIGSEEEKDSLLMGAAGKAVCENTSFETVACPAAATRSATHSPEMADDMARLTEMVKLTDLFGSNDMHKALLGNLYVQLGDKFRCGICEKVFQYKKIHSHLFIMHFDVPLLSCPRCQFGCPLKVDFRNHWQKDHPGEQILTNSLLVHKNNFIEQLNEKPLTAEKFKDICRTLVQSDSDSSLTSAGSSEFTMVSQDLGGQSPSATSASEERTQSVTIDEEEICAEGLSVLWRKPYPSTSKMTDSASLVSTKVGLCGVKSSRSSILSSHRKMLGQNKSVEWKKVEHGSAVERASRSRQLGASMKQPKISCLARPRSGTYKVVKVGAVSKFQCNACGNRTLSPASMMKHHQNCSRYLNAQDVSKHTDMAKSLASNMRFAGRSSGSLNSNTSPAEADLLTLPGEETMPKSQEKLQEPSQRKRKADCLRDSCSEDGDGNVDLSGDDDTSGISAKSEPVFSCKYCKFSASSSCADELQNHLQAKHADLLKGLLKCGHCSTVYGNMDRLKRHTAIHHEGKPLLKEPLALTDYFTTEGKENCSPKRLEAQDSSDIRSSEQCSQSEPEAKQRKNAEAVHPLSSEVKDAQQEQSNEDCKKVAEEEMKSRTKNHAKSTSKRGGSPERNDHKRTAAKIARLTMQGQLEGGGSETENSDDECDLVAHQQQQRSAQNKVKRFAFLDTEEFKRNIRPTPKPKSNLSVNSKEYQNKPGPAFTKKNVTQSATNKQGPAFTKNKLTESVASHKNTLALAKASFSTSTTVAEKLSPSVDSNSTASVSARQTAEKQPASTDPGSVVPGTSQTACSASHASREGKQLRKSAPGPAVSLTSQSTSGANTEQKGGKPANADSNQSAVVGGAKRNFSYICVTCNQRHIDQRSILAHLTRHLNYCTIPCGYCSMEFITADEAKRHHDFKHFAKTFIKKVSRDPRMELKLKQLMDESKQKAEEAVAKMVPSTDTEATADETDDAMNAISELKQNNLVECRQSIRCQQCEVLMDSLSKLKAHCETQHGGVRQKMEWMDMKSKSIYDITGNLVQEGRCSYTIIHKYLCAFCSFRASHKDMIQNHQKEAHTDLSYIWIVCLRTVPVATNTHQPNSTNTSSASVSATTPTASSSSASSRSPTSAEPPNTTASRAISEADSCTVARVPQRNRETGGSELAIASGTTDADRDSHGSDGPHTTEDRNDSDENVSSENSPRRSRGAKDRVNLRDPKLRSKTCVVMKDILSQENMKELWNLLRVNTISKLPLTDQLPNEIFDRMLKYAKK